MNAITLTLTEPLWPDLQSKVGTDALVVLQNTTAQVGVIPAATASGSPAIVFRLDLPDGRVVLYETTLGLLRMVMAGIRGRYPEEELDPEARARVEQAVNDHLEDLGLLPKDQS